MEAMSAERSTAATVWPTCWMLLTVVLGCAPAVEAAETHDQTPADATGHFQLADDRLVVELVAAEPNVVDPVAMCFDADGRLFVVEMGDFQLGPEGQDGSNLGRVRLLEDRDGDGKFEQSTVFADGLPLPTAVTAAYGGILVGAAPDIIFFKDTDGDGRADVRRELITGFEKHQAERLLNSLYWGLDNWIWGSGNRSGGKLRAADQPDAAKVTINDFRFRPSSATDKTADEDSPLSEIRIEAATGDGQFGMAASPWGQRFSTQNSRHVIHLVLPYRYLERNPLLAVSQVSRDCPDHKTSCRVFRISPPEAWREQRLKQRLAAGKGDRTPAGYLSAGSGALIYDGDALPPEYRGNSFVGAAANNLVHRDVLVEDGATFVARRAANEQDRDFLASPSVWFRPVAFGSGPDGALYVVDFHREMIETPLAIPEDMRKTIHWSNGNDQGRIYRVRSKKARHDAFRPLGSVASVDLVPLLGHANTWHRLTAQRLLVERQDRSVVDALETLVLESDNPLARLHALCTLDGLGAVDETMITRSLSDPAAGVREHALQLAESLLAEQPASRLSPSSPPRKAPPSLELVDAVLSLADDPSPRVRFQLAFTIGFLPQDDRMLSAMVQLVNQDASDKWCRSALLSSTSHCAYPLWQKLRAANSTLLAKKSAASVGFLRSLAEIIAAGGRDEQVAALLGVIANERDARDTWRQVALFDGIVRGAGRGNAAKRLSHAGRETKLRTPSLVLKLLDDDRQPIRRAARMLAVQLDWQRNAEINDYVAREIDVAQDRDRSLSERIEAIQFMGCGSFGVVRGPLEDLLDPAEPLQIQKAAIHGLADANRAEAADALIAAWQVGGPEIKQVVIENLASRSIYLSALLAAIERQDIPLWAVDSGLRERLLRNSDPKISKLAARVFSLGQREQEQQYERYRSELEKMEWQGDAVSGRDVFKAHCAACHQYDGLGHTVGPDLTTVVSRTPEQLLADIMLPSRSVTVGYEYYLLQTSDGRLVSGTIAGESATSITIRMQEGKEQTVMRTDIEEMTTSNVSMMPDNLYKDVSPKNFADLLEFIRNPPRKKNPPKPKQTAKVSP